MIQEIEKYSVELDHLVADIKKGTSDFVSKAPLRTKIADAGKRWLLLSTRLRGETDLPEDKVGAIDAAIEKVVELSANTNRKSTYVKVLTPLKKALQMDILVPLIRAGKTTRAIWTGPSALILNRAGSPEERAFYEEAFTCALHGCYKAATVMVTCGLIDRLRAFVVRRGLPAFNTMSANLKARTTGFYKTFNKDQNLTSENELQQVPEKDLIIIISGMVDLDLNQLNAIIKLLDSRNSCAHPSAYVMDELSFAHFLNEAHKLVLDNAKFV